MSKLPKTITINDLIFWICGKEPKDLFPDEEYGKYFNRQFDKRAVVILLDHYNESREIKPYLDYYFKHEPDDSFDSSLDPSYREYSINLQYKIFNWIHTDSDELSRPIEVEKTIKKARAFRKIALHYLAFIMAYEECSNDDLSYLLSVYLPNISAPENRISTWYELLYKWIGWIDSEIEDKHKLKITGHKCQDIGYPILMVKNAKT